MSAQEALPLLNYTMVGDSKGAPLQATVYYAQEPPGYLAEGWGALAM